MSKLHLYMDLTDLHAFRLYEGLPAMHEGLSVTHHNCNHDSHVNAMMS